MTEIQALLDDEESWRTGALDNAISQILVDLKPHDYKAWKWRFEDTFCIELDTVLKVMLLPTLNVCFCSKYTQMGIFPSQMFSVSMFQLGLGLLLILAIINTQLWSRVAWYVQLRRLFAVCFLISIIWNWFYMYKVNNKLWCFYCCCSIRTDRFATYLLFLSDCFCWSPKKHGEAGRNQWKMHWTEEIWLVWQFERWDIDWICLTGYGISLPLLF